MVPDDDGRATLAALDACLGQLSSRARHVLHLRFAERADRDTIARRLGVGTLAVKSILSRSYAALRACIERRLADDRS
ncbi:MAG: hypothetical protein IPM29_28210 [Planctomycetes bacterium]|nr:hypothetical protein [Planctomycetota bacterium]